MNTDRQAGHRDARRQPKGAGADFQVPVDWVPAGDMAGEGEWKQERCRPGIGRDAPTQRRSISGVARRSSGVLGAFHLPRREAPEVQMEPVQAGRRAVVRELQLVLHLVGQDAFAADQAWKAHAPAAPGAIRVVPRQHAGLKDFPRERPDLLFVGHRL